MDLTDENKKYIDSLSYKQLLSKWRFAPVGDPWFQGDTGDYWADRMSSLRSKPDGNKQHVKASKELGW